jgi:GTP diphosphokinase / guanosine-3',5'-bis(diphosphate) 3'-diphosphatase
MEKVKQRRTVTRRQAGKRLADDSIARILHAAAFAAERHRNQRRKGKEAFPYINHPIALATMLAEVGERDPAVLMAALLHDTVEDTATTFRQLEQSFGADVAAIVREVTDDKQLPRAERKRLQIEHAGDLSRRAKLVKLADKICNLRDISSSPPVGWSPARRREYFDWARQVVDRMRGTHAELEKLFDAAYAGGR